MKLLIQENPDIQEIEVVIHCREADKTIQRMSAALRAVDTSVTGSASGVIYQLSLPEVLYFESVNRKTFIYTDNRIFETNKRLYELEQELRNRTFFRASKAIVVNLCRARSVQSEIGARLILTMDNGEKIVVSRQYAGNIKRALEV